MGGGEYFPQNADIEGSRESFMATQDRVPENRKSFREAYAVGGTY
jgi:hypothetical protein